MKQPHYNVLIPLIDLGSNNNSLLEIYSTTECDAAADKMANEIGLEPVVAPLFAFNLAKMGLNALGRVRKYGLSKPLAAFYQWLNPQASLNQQRLHCSGGVAGRIDGESGELGMALALLMGVTHCADKHIIATGRLTPKLVGEAQYIDQRDAKIYPVGSVVEKLRLVLQMAVNQQLPAKTRYFFIPTTSLAEEIAQHGDTTQTLIQGLAQYHIQVKPVTWLSEAAKILNAHKTHSLAWDWVLRGILIFSVLISVVWGGYVWWRDRPIALAFLAGDEVTAPDKMPFIACLQDINLASNMTNFGVYDRIFPLTRTGYEYSVPTKSVLGWKLKIGDINSVDRFLYQLGLFDGYYVTQFIKSDKSDSKFLEPSLDDEILRYTPGDVWKGGFGLNDVAELNGIVLLVQRHAPFNRAKLREQLEAYLDSVEKPSINIVLEFLEHAAPGAKSFIFRTVNQSSPCQE